MPINTPMYRLYLNYQYQFLLGLSSCLHMPSKYVKNDMVSAHQKLLLLPCLWPIAQQSHRKVDKLGKCGSDKSVAVFLKASSQVKRQKIVFWYHWSSTKQMNTWQEALFSLLVANNLSTMFENHLKCRI